jgi:serine/threonine protein kinase
MTDMTLEGASPEMTRRRHGDQVSKQHASIAGFRRLRLIAQGGMGQVWEAEQEHPYRRVALKLIREDIQAPGLRRRFELEIEALARLNHDGIAKVFQAGIDPATKQPFFVMEYVEGETLDRWVGRLDPPRERRLEILIAICRAVQHAHQKGVIHRDLKPGNILVTGDGQPKILDFGIARLISTEETRITRETAAGDVIGTIGYMSPEQAAGLVGEVDALSDVYALGVIGFELLTGQLPIEVVGLPVHAAVRKIVEAEPTRLSTISTGLRGDLETIFTKATSKHRDRRYDAAASFASDLRRSLDDQPIAARAPSPWYTAKKFATRNKALVGGVIATFVVLVIGAAVSGFAFSRLESARVREAQQARVADAMGSFLNVELVPSATDGRVNLAETLNSSAESFFADAALDPAGEARTRKIFGDALVALGQLEHAEKHLNRAADLTENANFGTAFELELALARTIPGWRRGEEAAVEELAMIERRLLAAGPTDSNLRLARFQLASALKNGGSDRPLPDRLAQLERANELYQAVIDAKVGDDAQSALLREQARFDQAQLHIERAIASGGKPVDGLIDPTKALETALAKLAVLRADPAASQFPGLLLEIESEEAKVLHRLKRHAEAHAAYSNLVPRMIERFSARHWRTLEIIDSWFFLLATNGAQSDEDAIDPIPLIDVSRGIDLMFDSLADEPAVATRRSLLAAEAAEVADVAGLTSDATAWRRWLESRQPVNLSSIPGGK